MSVSSRLSEVLESSKEISFDDRSKFILFSDCHRGVNDWADDFAPNQNIFYYALDYYLKNHFTYIELGDGDELWENRKFEDIRRAHSHVFWKMTEFFKANRLYLLWGNHNRKWKNPEKVEKYLLHYSDEREQKPGAEPPVKPFFDGIQAHEGLILRHANTNKKIFLTHGHQGDLLNDGLWWFGKFVVRNIWKALQILGAHDPTSPAKNNKKRQKLEKQIIQWLNDNKDQIALLIVGHTHRPYLPKSDETPYCNTGSCVHPRCITGIEIQNGEISLVKWFVDTQVDKGGVLFIDKEILAGPNKI